MERTSEVIWRNHGALRDKSILMVNAPADGLAQQLSGVVGNLHCSTQDFAAYCHFLRSSLESSFELLPGEVKAADVAVLHLPREKERLHMLSHWLSSQMPPGGRLWVVGEIRGGIKSASRHLGKFFERVVKLDTARHCALLEASQPVQSEVFDLERWFRNWSFDYAGQTIEIRSLPGVFAHGRLDPGTRLLLDSLTALPLNGRVLDFACGSGVIAIALANARPEAAEPLELTLLDVSATAIESTRASLEHNRVEARLLPSDGTSELQGRFNWIVSNPPFHRGIQQTLDVSKKFFSDAGTFLAENGKIVIVCNRHLPYEEWLRERFNQVKRLAVNNEFSVLLAAQPAT